MTISAINPNQSTPFTGLTTLTYEVQTTSLYTCTCQAFLPWMTSDQPEARANPPAGEVQTVTMVADVSGSLNSTYWTFYLAGNAAGYYVWYNINGAGVNPAPAGLTGIEVSAATGATASTLASDSAAAINAALLPTANNPATPALTPGYTTATAASAVLTLTANQVGAMTAAANGTASPGFTYAVTTTGTFGYESGLVITLAHNGTTVLVSNNTSGSTALLSCGTTLAATAGDTITFTTSSLAQADQYPNAVKGIVNVYNGPAV